MQLAAILRASKRTLLILDLDNIVEFGRHWNRARHMIRNQFTCLAAVTVTDTVRQ